jgi:hypothetical protein
MLSLYALFRIRDSSERSLELIQFHSSVSELHNAMEEVCVMGDGNLRLIYLKREVTVVSQPVLSSYGITFTDFLTHSKLSKTSRCDLHYTAQSYNGKTKVKNKNGKINIEN